MKIEETIFVLKNKGNKLSQKQKLQVVFWHLKWNIKRNNWKESLLTIKCYFQQAKYAVWFGQQYDYRINFHI